MNTLQNEKIIEQTRQVLFNIIDCSLKLSNVKYVVSVKHPELLPFITDEIIEHNADMYFLVKKLQKTNFEKRVCMKMERKSKTYKKGEGAFYIDLSKTWD